VSQFLKKILFERENMQEEGQASSLLSMEPKVGPDAGQFQDPEIMT